MAKSNPINLSAIDVNSHDFTLSALSVLFDKSFEHEKTLTRLVRSTRSRAFFSGISLIYLMYKSYKLNKDVYELKEKVNSIDK